MNRSKLVLSFVAIALLMQATAHAQGPRARTETAVDPALATLIEASVMERLGAGVSVEVTEIDLALTPGEADGPWVEAKPDPVARLGQPIRVTLVAEGGRSARAVVTMRVVADYVVARRAIGRAHTVTTEDVDAVRGELVGTPLRPMPGLADVVGGRALRPIDAEAPVLSGYVLAPRVVDPGDTITVVVRSGAVVVSATFTAADGGGVGDIIRVSNPDTRRFIKARIVERGLAEVVYES